MSIPHADIMSWTEFRFKSFYEFYPSQTKILEGLTKDEIQIFDILFQGREYSIWATNQ